MIGLMRAFHLMDDGNISMLVGDSDLNNSFNRGGTPFLQKSVRADCWIYLSCLCFLTLEPAMSGNSLLNRERNTVEVKDLPWAVWICLKEECLALIKQILTELTVMPHEGFATDDSYCVERVYRRIACGRTSSEFVESLERTFWSCCFTSTTWDDS